MGVVTGPLSATRLRAIASYSSFGMYSPCFSNAPAPAANFSHANCTPVASRIRTTASVTSGPMPSPGISVIVCVFFTSFLIESDSRAMSALLLFAWFLTVVAQQLLQLFLELAHVLKVPINARKANVCHRVQDLQPLHNQLADLRRRALPLAGLGHVAFRLIHQLFQLRRGNRPLLARVQQPAQHLL